MATLSDIADLDSGVVSSEATPESRTTPTSGDDKVISDKKEANSEGALDELVSSAVTAASKDILQPKQNSDVSSTVLNDDDEEDDENYEMIQEPESDISIITISEENTPTRDVKEGSEEIKGEVGNVLEEIPVPSEAVSSREAVEDVSNNQEVVGDDVALSAVTVASQELAENEVVSTASVTTVEATPVDDKEVGIDVTESEPQSFESFAIINDNSIDGATFADNTNVESIKESARDAETINEPSQKAVIINETNQEAEVLFDTPLEIDTVHMFDSQISNDSDHNTVSVADPVKDVEIISDSAKESVTIEPDSSINSEALIESAQDAESISELNEKSEIISELAQDNQNAIESAQVSTSSLSTTLTKVEQDKDGECYEMISDPDSGLATPESLAVTPTSEEIVVPPPPPPVEEAEEVKEEVKEEVVEQVITSGVAAAVEAASAAAAAAPEPQPTPAAKETTTEATPSTTTTAAAASSTTSDSSKTSAPKSDAKVAEPSKPSSSSVTSSTTTVAKVDTANQLDEDDDDDEGFDESLGERIWGLTEMFPDSLRSGSINTVSAAAGFLKGTYEMSRSVVWIAVSSSLLLFAPVMFELERINVEEMMKQDRNRLVLGPGSAMSGGPPPGLMSGPAR